MPRRTRWVGPSDLVEEFGFTTRHWIKMATAGRVPSARQPFGPRSSWVFDIEAVRAWWASTEAKPWEPPVRLKRAIPKRRYPETGFEPVDLKKAIAETLATRSEDRKRRAQRAWPAL